MEANTIAIGHRWDFTKGDKIVFTQDGGIAGEYYITEVRSETIFSFALRPGFGEGIYGEENLEL